MKHISVIDNVANLQALVRHELREFGIKVPKAKKPKRGTIKHNQDVFKEQIFGNYLAGVHCVHVADCGYVAQFLVDAAKIIDDNIENEGVFRKSGAVSKQKEIKQQLENGKSLDGANVHNVTALVKQFFRELPEPLFTSVYHDTFVRCYQLESTDTAARAILLLCLLLPSEHISTLRFLMKLLAKIAKHSEQNKMDFTNLALILAPNIMHVNSKSETMKSCEEKLLQVQTAVVELLIRHADDVGMVEEELVERTAFMSEVFSTDDELDASEDNLDDTKEKKKKKRKRSGSFGVFVSNLTQSITKWRRSTDGKTNTSGMSHASNASHASAPGHTEDMPAPHHNQGYQFNAVDATPVMKKTKQQVPATEGRAFSASKKKAILNQLPQHATLASTPFTPASCKKPGQGMKRGHDTPSIPPRPYQTPRQNMKTRKKIALFSPASTTKKKRYSSTSNLSMPSAVKKVSKPKKIFRRLSGSKGDQMFSEKNNVGQQIGQRLAGSPTSTVSAPTMNTSTLTHGESSKNITDKSPIAAISQSSFSASLCEQSIMSTYEDDRRSLNEGFIFTDEKEGDITRIMSEPAIAGSHDNGEYVMLGDVMPRESFSDTTMMSDSRLETPRGHSRSFSVDSTLDISTKKGSLKRGRPNSVRVGLLNGDHSEVHKLRRSFGLDKSDIGFPIPVSVANVSDEDQYVELDCSVDFLNTASKVSEVTADSVAMEIDYGKDFLNDSPGSVSRTKSTASLASNNTEHMITDNTGNETRNECDNGFSTISGGTAVFVPKTKICAESKDIDGCENTGTARPAGYIQKTLAQQKQESKDSLLSEASSVLSPVMIVKAREMTRSVSADSGQGSICDESRGDSPDVTKDSIYENIQDERQQSRTIMMDESENVKSLYPSTDMLTPTAMECSSDSVFNDTVEGQSAGCESMTVNKAPLQQKSVSTQDLQKEFEHTPTRVSRSKSLLETSLAQKKVNIKPNLQISAETHNLLARAGYIKAPKLLAKPDKDFDDFAVPGSFPFIKQAESLNPRRESIIALQKNNAGHVRNNVRQFDKITEVHEHVVKEVDNRKSSPFRFPQSTSRRMRIPFAFQKSEKDIEAIRQCLQASREKMPLGTAKVPISTQMVKPSDPESSQENSSFTNEKSTGLKRKPSIYYADKESPMPPASKARNVSGMLDTTTEMDESVRDETYNNSNTTDQKSSLWCQLELDQSLLDNINEVCTPLSEKVKLNTPGDKMNRTNKENYFSDDVGCKMPGIKPSILTTPLDTVKLRTASNKTPIELFKTSNSPRSPIKPLKRLGSSPHSPRSRVMHSPKLIKSNRRSLLSTIPNQNDDLNNL